ncbi:MAG TPA: FAD:protein FMN transferase [Wenzhouxiangella sp.]|nr:FAD:protein FMN transferase [Wenzhouxiangella sp.]
MTGCEGERPPSDYQTLQGPTMGTIYTVRYRPAGAATAPAAVRREIETLLERIDAEFSTWREDSQLSQFNRAPAGQWVPVSAGVVNLVKQAIALGEKTGGAVDMTIEPVLELWGFAAGERERAVPDPAALAAALELVDDGLIEWRERPPALRKKKDGLRASLDFLVAGLAADQAAARLEAMGIEDFLVDMGGELRMAGNSPQDQPWRVAIERPATGPRRIERVLTVTDIGLSTSGDYRNYFVHEGRRYAHLFDARSGWPVEHEVASVTVVAPRAVDADGYATALLVLGPSAGPALAERLDLAALFILRDEGGGWRELATGAFERQLAAGLTIME